jgi:N utilization substance protein A
MTTTNFDLLEALQQMARDKGITVETLFDALANALVAAYKRLPSAAEEAVVTIDPDVGEIRVYGQELDDEGNVIREWDDTPADFGRIAAQAAKQVLMQRVREAERDRKYEEYAGREGDIVTGIIQQTDSRFTLLDLGKVEALLPQAEQVPYERYDHGARLKAYIVEVRKTTKGPQIVVSRSHPGLIKRLFELEVPEISNGIVEIKACAREPGHRTKIAVWSNDANVDPVGACVGARGARVRMVTTELRGEKVDIVPFSDDPAEFVARALQPARVKEVLLDEERGRATVIVHDYQLSLAIGKEGQNARLAARLTGWHIDIRSESEVAAEQAAYEQADWAEGEWVEDDSGEMVWRPAEGGESVSAEQWAAGGTDESGEGTPEATSAPGEAAGEAVSAGEPKPAGEPAAVAISEPEAEAIAEVVAEVEAEVEFVADVVAEVEGGIVAEAEAELEAEAEIEAEAELEEEDEELEEVSVELELSAEDETDYPGIDDDTPSVET